MTSIQNKSAKSAKEIIEKCDKVLNTLVLNITSGKPPFHDKLQNKINYYLKKEKESISDRDTNFMYSYLACRLIEQYRSNQKIPVNLRKIYDADLLRLLDKAEAIKKIIDKHYENERIEREKQLEAEQAEKLKQEQIGMAQRLKQTKLAENVTPLKEYSSIKSYLNEDNSKFISVNNFFKLCKSLEYRMVKKSWAS